MNVNVFMVPLPPGVRVESDPLVGVTFYEDGNDYPLTQHPWDCDAVRKLVWHNWLMRHPEMREKNER